MAKSKRAKAKKPSKPCDTCGKQVEYPPPVSELKPTTKWWCSLKCSLLRGENG